MHHDPIALGQTGEDLGLEIISLADLHGAEEGTS